ncbi:MAG: hypothetical protein IT453_12210 [Planctomycetes bacterium]|nr:hypothetical protein [Planctomycetota bacterium]
MKRLLPILAVSCAVVSLAPNSVAQTQWAGNGHYYEYVPGNWDWPTANATAQTMSFQGVQGHLVTFSGKLENDWVHATFVAGLPNQHVWIGLYQDFNSPSYSEPDGGWTWVNGETWPLSQWLGGEPNNGGGTEDYGEYYLNKFWNDIASPTSSNNGFVVEYDFTLAPKLNPANGHYYLAVPATIDWHLANDLASASTYNGWPGHLATISDQAEDDFVYAQLPVPANKFWLGLTQFPALPSFVEPAGGFAWLTGEPLTFTNWETGQPDDQYGLEHFLTYKFNKQVWWDVPADFATLGYVIEYEPLKQTTYCTGKTNSAGCAPALALYGSPRATATKDFVVDVTGLRNQEFAMLFYGFSGSNAKPFKGGTLCLKAPVRRTPFALTNGSPMGTIDCSGSFRLDLNAYAAGLLGGKPSPALRVPGTTVYCQLWAIDSGIAPPQNVQLSSAAYYTVYP